MRSAFNWLRSSMTVRILLQMCSFEPAERDFTNKSVKSLFLCQRILFALYKKANIVFQIRCNRKIKSHIESYFAY